MASAKIRIKIIPTNSFGSWAFPRTPASPTIPIAYPEDYGELLILLLTNAERPQQRPAARCLNPSYGV